MEILIKQSTVLIDDDDFGLICDYKWYIQSVSECKYAVARTTLPNGKIKVILMHRLIIKPLDCYEIDHIDGNGLNNQKDNLRTCRHRDNIRNRRKHKKGSSTYKGVSWDTQKKRWRAYIHSGGKRIRLGDYKTEKDAASAYNKAAKLIFQEFANLNNIY